MSSSSPPALNTGGGGSPCPGDKEPSELGSGDSEDQRTVDMSVALESLGLSPGSGGEPVGTIKRYQALLENIVSDCVTEAKRMVKV